jgi:hypothetical protein
LVLRAQGVSPLSSAYSPLQGLKNVGRLPWVKGFYPLLVYFALSGLIGVRLFAVNYLFKYFILNKLNI